MGCCARHPFGWLKTTRQVCSQLQVVAKKKPVMQPSMADKTGAVSNLSLTQSICFSQVTFYAEKKIRRRAKEFPQAADHLAA
jgi:hypothetical protein